MKNLLRTLARVAACGGFPSSAHDEAVTTIQLIVASWPLSKLGQIKKYLSGLRALNQWELCHDCKERCSFEISEYHRSNWLLKWIAKRLLHKPSWRRILE